MRDLETFLAPVADDSPSGVELRNDPRFHAIERLLEPAARSRRLEARQSGGSGEVALDIDEILGAAEPLAETGRDLRLLVIVARASANESGFAGLGAGLTLLSETVSRYWDSLHPELRVGSTKKEAAVRRINALYQIENDDNGILCDLDYAIFLAPRGLGPVSGGDLAAATLNRNTLLSEGPSGLGEKEKSALVAAHEARVTRVLTACKATAAEAPEVLDALARDVASATDALGGLEDALNAQISENGTGVKFHTLRRFLDRVAATLATANDATAPASREEPMTPAPDAPRAAAPPQAPAPTGGIPAGVTSRRDVERCLDMIIDFYERTEPSSPIPHLARRMRKMVPMNFVELMEEIAPSGMKEFRTVAGVFEERSK
jgi:type VI secretion system protein ImpA